MNRDINHGGYNILALVFLKLKSTRFSETKGLQLWNPKLTLLPLSWKRLRIKDVSDRELEVVTRVSVSTEEFKYIYIRF